MANRRLIKKGDVRMEKIPMTRVGYDRGRNGRA